MKRMLACLLAFGVAVGYGPVWAQEKDEEKKQEGEKPAAKKDGEKGREAPAPKKREGDREGGKEGPAPAKKDGERKEGEKPAPAKRDGEKKEGEGDKAAPAKRPAGEGERKEGDKAAPAKRAGGEGDRKEGEKAVPAKREGGEGDRKEGEKPAVRDGERKEGEKPVRRDGDPRPARGVGEGEKPAPAEPPIAVDDRVISKNEAQPTLVGRVQSVFKDGGNTLLTLRVPGRSPVEVSIQIQSATSVSYYGLEKTQEQPTAGYLAYVWLKSGSKDVASSVRFTAEKK